jgi:tetratricopeptide (TPR) repeat protein
MMASPDAVPTPVSRPKAADAAAAVEPNTPVNVSLHWQGENLRLDFPFSAPTPAAVFRRGSALWLVFDTTAKVNLAALKNEKLVRRAALIPGQDNAVVLRLELEKPQLASFFAEGRGWTLVIGNSVVEPTAPLAVARSIVGKGRSTITIPFADPRALHRITDPDAGDALLVVTALGPARGFLKPQEFVELRALASTHGIVVQPLADDITAELAADKIVIGRPGGLSLSSAGLQSRDNNKSALFQPMMFDTQTWGFDRQANFDQRQAELIERAAMAPENKRRAARLDLARFYLAREMAAEAKGVLDVIVADEREGEGTTGTVLKAVANVMLGRPDDALKDLNDGRIGNNSDAPIWRAMAHSYQGRFAQARAEFRNVEVALGALPIELQRIAKREALLCSIEVRDFAGASSQLNEFETLGVPPEMTPTLAVLTGRLEEGLGHNADALSAYRRAAGSRDRRYAAQGHLRDLVLRSKMGDIKRNDMIDQLETLTTNWRGDETEAEGLKLLAHLYTEDKRYRDAFHVMRTALVAHPNSDLTRKIQDEAAATFDSLFMTTEADAMPAIQALGLFYDYKELTPIGRRGDEMIRRLADRLVSVDLLDQAGELLQHQVDHRLMGAARAQVATRLAIVYLMNRKPDRALAAIRNSRTSDLSTDLRDQRLLLEARALSDIGRHELALEIIAGMKGREAQRLRADVLWAAKKWREAGEQFELLYGNRWKDPAPLTTAERNDVLRAAVAYALAEEQLSLARFREKYAGKMTEGADQRAFEVVTAPIGSGSAEFRAVAGVVANTSTLDAFLADLRKRFPDKDEPASNDTAASPPETVPAAATGGKAAANSPVPDKAPAGTPRKADPSPTGSIGRQPRNVRR